MTPEEAMVEARTALQAVGAWPAMREEQAQLEAALTDTFRRFGALLTEKDPQPQPR